MSLKQSLLLDIYKYKSIAVKILFIEIIFVSLVSYLFLLILKNQNK